MAPPGCLIVCRSSVCTGLRSQEIGVGWTQTECQDEESTELSGAFGSMYGMTGFVLIVNNDKHPRI